MDVSGTALRVEQTDMTSSIPGESNFFPVYLPNLPFFSLIYIIIMVKQTAEEIALKIIEQLE